MKTLSKVEEDVEEAIGGKPGLNIIGFPYLRKARSRAVQQKSPDSLLGNSQKRPAWLNQSMTAIRYRMSLGLD
jgi:hypothetical protein